MIGTIIGLLIAYAIYMALLFYGLRPRTDWERQLSDEEQMQALKQDEKEGYW